jgi:hypothetical protein
LTVKRQQYLAAFCFIGASPDSVGFTDVEGVGKTVFDHGALPANVFGSSFAREFFVLALKPGRGKENLGLWASTCRFVFPTAIRQCSHILAPPVCPVAGNLGAFVKCGKKKSKNDSILERPVEQGL